MMPLSQVGPSPTMEQPQPMGFVMTAGQPVMMQQGAMPSAAHGWPRGLEMLANTDHLIIQQQKELFEAITGFEMANKYKVKTATGQTVYYAYEQTSCLNRCCCGSSRPFDMTVLDIDQKEVLSMHRPLRCSWPCCSCCSLQELEVSTGGVPLASVTQEASCWSHRFSVRGPGRDVRLQIHGPCCVIRCCSDVDFPVMSADGQRRVGTLTKLWGGMVKECCTDTKTFSVAFPPDLDPATKIGLFSAAFLLGYIFYERNNNNN